MAVQVLTDSYVTLADAVAYLDSRLGAPAWKAASDSVKEQALRSAASKLDEMTWGGTAVADSQPMAFPRVLEYFDARIGGLVYIDGSSVPDRIKTAQIELAAHLLDNPDVLVESDSLRNMTVGPIAMVGMAVAPLIPSTVMTLIRPLLEGGASQNAWWRSN